MSKLPRVTCAAPLRGVWLGALFVSLIMPFDAHAQNGDRQGEIQKENWRQWSVPPAPVLSPADAIEAFQIAPGFSVELVASEPEVVDPVAMAWDERGRLWVVELRGYMPTVDGDGETEPVGQVVVLEDKDGDGHYETSHLFLDRLVNPRAIAIVEGGVLIGEPPHLWYCQDLDGDLRCDRRTSLTNYGTDNPDHVEHTDNGLIHSLDNWIYNSKSSRKFRFDVVGEKPQLKESSTAFRGQWGLAQDDYGRLYFNHNSTWILADSLPTDLLLANPWCGRIIGQPARSGHTVVPDPSTFPVRVNPGINRGYQPPMLRPDGRLRRNTAASGIAILRSDRWGPEWNGITFVPEAAGNLVAAFLMEEIDFRMRGQQLVWPHTVYGKQAFLASTDERFRPVDAKLGPDGNLYVIDMYRGIIQHRQFVTTYLRKQIEERGLAEPVGLGRIWRIVRNPDDFDATPAPEGLPLLSEPGGQIKALSHPVGWIRDTAQRLLVEAGSSAEVGELQQLLAQDSAPVTARIHALRILDGLGALLPGDLANALGSDDPLLRRSACQVFAENPQSHPEWEVCLPLLLKPMEPSGSLTPLEILHRALALASLKENEEALNSVIALLKRNGHAAEIRMAVLSQWDDYQVERLSRFLAAEFPVDGTSAFVPLVNELTRSALLKDPHSLPLILAMLEELASDDPRFAAVISGLHFVMTQKRWAPPPISTLPEVLQRADLPRDLKAPAETIITHLKKSDSPPPDLKPWSEEERRWAKAGARAFASSCSACHGAGGQGLPGLGPTLLDSPWLLGADPIPIKIILDGLTGPITVSGEHWDLTMPGHRENPKLKDDDIAGLLTWLRRQWGHTGNPVSPELVTKIRQMTADRRLPWTDESLNKGAD